MYSDKVHEFNPIMEKIINCDETRNRPAPSSPRQFFQRLYGHLEDNDKTTTRVKNNKSEIDINHLNSDTSCSENSSVLSDEFKESKDNNRNNCAQITSNYIDSSAISFPINTLSPPSSSSSTPLPIMPQHFSSLRTITDINNDYHQTVFPPGLSAFRE
jgi:hypothetical protein